MKLFWVALHLFDDNSRDLLAGDARWNANRGVALEEVDHRSNCPSALARLVKHGPVFSYAGLTRTEIVVAAAGVFTLSLSS